MKELIERYYQGLTTLDEERQLAAHFAAHPSDDEPLLSSLHLLNRRVAARRDHTDKTARVRSRHAATLRIAAAITLIIISAGAFLLRPAPADLGCYPPDLTPEQALATINDAFAQVDHAKTATLNALTI